MAYPRAPLRRFARRRSSFFSSSEEAPVRMVLTVLRALLMTNPYFYASRSRVAVLMFLAFSSRVGACGAAAAFRRTARLLISRAVAGRGVGYGLSRSAVLSPKPEPFSW